MDSLAESLSKMTSDFADCAAALNRIRKGSSSKGDFDMLSTLLEEFSDLHDKAQACVHQYDSQADYALSNFFDDPFSALEQTTSSEQLTSVLRLSPLHISVTMNGIHFLTVMHAFQASKVLYDKKYAAPDTKDFDDDQKKRMKMFANEDLSTVNTWGSARGSIDLDVSRWDKDKTYIMRELLIEARKQNTHVADALKTTSGEIYEDALPDLFWGHASGTGRNTIGKLWQEIRDQPDEAITGRKDESAQSSNPTKKRKTV